jgi:hypothetical protein
MRKVSGESAESTHTSDLVGGKITDEGKIQLNLVARELLGVD